jgi:hypothetical protein
MTGRQKLLLALFIVCCLVLAGLRVYSIGGRNEGLIEIISQ